jgi:HK97 gp10 family phage protein
MVVKTFELAFKGFEQLKEALLNLAPLMRRKRGTRAMAKGAEVVREASKRINVVPVLARPLYRRGQLWRKPGTVRDAISIRISKDGRANGDVGVFVNVKPAKGSDRGANSPNDPFYWRFLHFKTKANRVPKPFLLVGARELEGDALRAVERALGDEIRQLNLPGIKQ